VMMPPRVDGKRTVKGGAAARVASQEWQVAGRRGRRPRAAARRATSCGKARYELRRDDRVLGAIQVLDWRQRGVRVEDGDGAAVGLIRTVDEGYSLIVERPLAEPLGSLVVASAICLRAAIGDESYPGSHVEDGGGTTVARTAVLPPIFDPLRRKPAGGSSRPG
jgi:hypothetical protein